jgi:malate dehydrogenase (oxaloacetate-decarboxylating)
MLLRRAERPLEDSLRLHRLYRGKVQTAPKCPIRSVEDFAVWYTPGVAAPSQAIAAQPDLVYEHTNRGNTVAVVSDGTRVLGLGDIGPEAALPVMEGKALLFKYLGGVDAVPICLATRDADEIVRTVRLLAPSFAAINLEDIAQPKCFRILEALRAECPIPVWHDDQQGSAAVVLAGLINALKVVDKRLESARITLIGAGAANIAVQRLLVAAGARSETMVVCDREGILHRGRADIASSRDVFREKWRICTETNARAVTGKIDEALRAADVCIAFSQSGPGVIRPEWIKTMASSAIVFACANPIPEIWPWEAQAAGARIVATGRSDFPNQVNNSLCFPGIFRGVFDVRATNISDRMTIAAANELAACAETEGISDTRILPTMDEWHVAARVAVATAVAARAEGLAVLKRNPEELYEAALARISTARCAAEALVEKGCIMRNIL